MLTVESSAILSRMAVLYLLPVFGILAGAFTGAFMYGDMDGTGGGHSVAFGLAGFVLGFVFAVGISRIWSAARPIMPVISRIVNTRLASPSADRSAGCGCGAIEAEKHYFSPLWLKKYCCPAICLPICFNRS